ncbi:MAG: hypothetical protein IPK82_00030 [Polyangiaceae bacterium]|nr:hypothetical protein [Polyangiaceae bacterium]
MLIRVVYGAYAAVGGSMARNLTSVHIRRSSFGCSCVHLSDAHFPFKTSRAVVQIREKSTQRTVPNQGLVLTSPDAAQSVADAPLCLLSGLAAQPHVGHTEFLGRGAHLFSQKGSVRPWLEEALLSLF